jgi:uncharacterized PurR-regulated membrane protein YhhQ (DUF165 family)
MYVCMYKFTFRSSFFLIHTFHETFGSEYFQTSFLSAMVPTISFSYLMHIGYLFLFADQNPGFIFSNLRSRGTR